MKRNIILIIASFLLTGSTVFGQHKIKAEDAKNYVTPDTVVGKVFEIKTTDKVTYINLDGKYPNNPFAAVILDKNKEKVGDVSKYDGKTIDVIGNIIKYNGRGEIIVNNASQIMLDK